MHSNTLLIAAGERSARDVELVTSSREHIDARPAPSPADWKIEVFYDGDCPLCRREIDMLRRLDRRHQIRFTNIATSEFRASDFGVSWDDLMSEIHGRLPDGTWVRGVEVFRKLYAAIGWTPVVWISRLPIIAGLLDRAYRLFARNRLRWTRRCVPGGTNCKLDNRESKVAESR
jgi:predicted DCC family thiol-disulfide oxidoreductase YuxK